MLVIVKRVFYDESGLHRKGDKVEVNNFDENLMELVEEKPKKKSSEKNWLFRRLVEIY